MKVSFFPFFSFSLSLSLCLSFSLTLALSRFSFDFFFSHFHSAASSACVSPGLWTLNYKLYETLVLNKFILLQRVIMRGEKKGSQRGGGERERERHESKEHWFHFSQSF